MNLTSFTKKFPDEESCRIYLKTKREEQGIVCKKCNGTKHYWLKPTQRWKCADCGSHTNLRSGTIMEKSKMPVYDWFLCIHLMTSIKKSFSSLEMQKQLGYKRYEPAWFMMQKIRKAMGKRDAQYQLKGEIEIDEGFFEIVDDPAPKDDLGNKIEDDGLTKPKENKRGRGTDKAIVMVMVESKANPEQTNPHKKKRIMGYTKMKVIDSLETVGINYEIKKAIDPQSTVITDGYRSYNQLKDIVEKHVAMVVPANEAGKKLPWVHTVISNAKRLFLGTHHSINRGYLQNYLNEFCYKLNRRNFTVDMFDRMITAGVNDTWY